MNEVRLSGKVLNAYVNDAGHFVCVLAVLHNHLVDGYNTPSESVIRCFLADRGRSEHIDIVRGDKVLITGYLRQDRSLSSTGNERKRVNVYIKDIELTNPMEGGFMSDFTRRIHEADGHGFRG